MVCDDEHRLVESKLLAAVQHFEEFLIKLRNNRNVFVDEETLLFDAFPGLEVNDFNLVEVNALVDGTAIIIVNGPDL